MYTKHFTEFLNLGQSCVTFLEKLGNFLIAKLYESPGLFPILRSFKAHTRTLIGTLKQRQGKIF